MKALLIGGLAACLLLGAPVYAFAQKDDDLSGLVAELRSKLNELREGDGGEVPLGQLAKELDQARQDIERLAELVLRNEITELRQKAAFETAVREIEALTSELEGTETTLAGLREERQRMEAFVAESSERIDELAEQLISADNARRSLELALEGSRAEALAAKSELDAASQRIANIDSEINQLIATYDERVKSYETDLEMVSNEVTSLEAELRRQRNTFRREIAAKDEDIAELNARQTRARDILVQALGELDQVAGKEATAYEQEMLRSAEISTRARSDVLEDLGFSRNERGQLLPPEIDLSSANADAGAIEPAAGHSKGSCDGMMNVVDRAYLDDKASEDWKHFLIGTLRFDEAATQSDNVEIRRIVGCLKELSREKSIYFKLIGHTDAKGTSSFNERLSLARAQAVRDVFGDFVAIQPWRLFAQGRGERYPVADNDTEQGRELNRRVEVFAVRSAF